MPPEPRIRVYDHARCGLDIPQLRSAAQEAVPLVLALRIPERDVLSSLPSVEVSLVDDPTIARLHHDYLQIDGPTDVLSFDHGEIFVSTDIAAAQAPLHGATLTREILLYIVHGLLHLAGHRDGDPTSARQMGDLQAKLLDQIA